LNESKAIETRLSIYNYNEIFPLLFVEDQNIVKNELSQIAKLIILLEIKNEYEFESYTKNSPIINENIVYIQALKKKFISDNYYYYRNADTFKWQAHKNLSEMLDYQNLMYSRQLINVPERKFSKAVDFDIKLVNPLDFPWFIKVFASLVFSSIIFIIIRQIYLNERKFKGLTA
jgi:hypothetical protein